MPFDLSLSRRAILSLLGGGAALWPARGLFRLLKRGLAN